jgi:hypothetical protein
METAPQSSRETAFLRLAMEIQARPGMATATAAAAATVDEAVTAIGIAIEIATGTGIGTEVTTVIGIATVTTTVIAFLRTTTPRSIKLTITLSPTIATMTA